MKTPVSQLQSTYLVLLTYNEPKYRSTEPITEELEYTAIYLENYSKKTHVYYFFSAIQLQGFGHCQPLGDLCVSKYTHELWKINSACKFLRIGIGN